MVFDNILILGLEKEMCGGKQSFKMWYTKQECSEIYEPQSLKKLKKKQTEADITHTRFIKEEDIFIFAIDKSTKNKC